MKKTIKSLLTVLLVLVLITGCGKKNDTPGGGEASTDDEFTLTIWVMPFVGADLREDIDAVYDNMVKDFTEKYPKAKVEFEEIPWANREQKITTTLAAGAGPDIFYLISDQVTQFAEDGVVAPIDDITKDIEKDKFSQPSLDAVSYKGKLYGLPILRTTETLMYNKKIVDELGLDVDAIKTWDDFLAAAEKAKAAGYYARSFEGGNTLNSTLYPLIWQAGGKVADVDNNIFIDKPEATKAFAFVNEMLEKGYIPADSVSGLDHAELFMKDEMLAVWTAGRSLDRWAARPDEDGGPMDIIVGDPLMAEGGQRVTYGTTGAFVVSSVSKNKEAAADFLKIMTNEDNIREFNKVTGYIPPREAAHDIFEGNADAQKMAELDAIAIGGVINAKARIFMPDIQAKMQAMLQGELTPEEATKEAAEAIQASFQ